ncbi:MAG: sodium-dependent transporter, partial [Clostridia bacterium]|nr:sodium-dependent transporter [Clostridia bacterium]
FVSNSVLLPIVGMLTCVMIGFVTTPKLVTDEVELNGRFATKRFYTLMVKWVAPIFILLILVSSVLQGFGIISI